MRRMLRILLVLWILPVILTGCMHDISGQTAEESNRISVGAERPDLPDDLDTDSQGIPVLDVYNVSTKSTESMNIEEYLLGVVAGEMKNDWPIEALKAQAILARTFVLKFCDTKDSVYDDADISTDVREAQAYAPENINERVRRAVEETRGEVMSSDGEFVNAWFFAHAGGRTELPSVSLDYKKGDPEYLSSVVSPDSDKAPEDVKSWTAEFDEEVFVRACKESGLEIEAVHSVKVGERGESGRAKTLMVNGTSVSAPTLRIKIGANQMKSTLIDDIEVSGGRIIISGRGFGHGVGMSQWGAYALAEEGKSAEEIVRYYFDGIDIVDLW